MAGSVASNWSLEPFKRTDDAGTTADRLEKYLKRADLMFKIIPREEGEQVLPDIKKKALIQIWGGEDLIYIWETMAKPPIEDNTTYSDAIQQVKAGLLDQTNELFPIYNLFQRMPQGKKPIRLWMQEVLDAAKRCKLSSTCGANCAGAYTAERAARDAVVFQTSNERMRKKALAEAPDFTQLLKIGQSMETAESQAEKISFEEYSSSSSRKIAEVHETEMERTIARVLEKQLGKFDDKGRQGRGRGQPNGRNQGQMEAGRSLQQCPMCQSDWPKPNHICPALTVPCSTCGTLGHWTRPTKETHPQCKATNRSENDNRNRKQEPEPTGNQGTARRLEDALEETHLGYVDSLGGGYAYDPEIGVYSTRAVFQDTQASTRHCRVKVKVNGQEVDFICDSGTDITMISEDDWTRIQSRPNTDVLEPTEKQVRTYGTTSAGVGPFVPLAGQSIVRLTAERGAEIETLIVVARGAAENLLGEREATALGILKIEAAGANTAQCRRTENAAAHPSKKTKTKRNRKRKRDNKDSAGPRPKLSFMESAIWMSQPWKSQSQPNSKPMPALTENDVDEELEQELIKSEDIKTEDCEIELIAVKTENCQINLEAARETVAAKPEESTSKEAKKNRKHRS